MEVKERIVVESFALFIRYGIRSVTMDEIARQMGISKKTIYENFRDKDGLLKESILHHKSINEKNIDNILISSKNILEAIYKVMFETVSNMQKVNPLFFSDMRKYHHKLCNEFMPGHEKDKIDMLKGMIEKGKNDGIFIDSVHAETAATLMNQLLKAVSDDDVFPSDTYSRPAVFRSIVEIFTRGMATPQGIKIINKIIKKNEKKNQN